MSQPTPPDDKAFDISVGAAMAHGCCGGLGATRLPKFAIGLQPSDPDSGAGTTELPAAGTAASPSAAED